MDSLNNQIIKEIDRLVGKKIDEAYVTEPKKFDLRTDLLSDKTKTLRQASFERRVDTLNKVSARLDTVDRDQSNPNSSEFRSLKIDETHNINASFLRALHFENVSDLNSRITMDMMCYLRLERDFGSFDSWQKDFIACGMASRDGYAVTGYSIYLKRYLNFMIDTESLNVPVGIIPLIVLDVAEGAYYLDYAGDRKKYILSMMRELSWEKIEKRFEKSEAVSKVYAQ
jgi:Fe-Mn family superoxide dismutase